MDAARHVPAPPVTSEPVTALVGGLGSTGTSGRRGGDPGGDGSASRPAARAGRRGSVATTRAGVPAVATDSWPSWARPQLRAAVSLAARVAEEGAGRGLASELRRRWYAPELGDKVELDRNWGPLGGMYRRAHAGTAAPVTRHGIAVVDRHDVISRDGWWRTWSDDWSPTRSRAESVRVLLSPRPEALPEFVNTLTAALLAEPMPWLLACPTDPRRLRHAAAAILYVPDATAIAPSLALRLRPLLRNATPPLCLPIAPGIAVSEKPRNGMSFGEHRCHLVALALARPNARRAPLEAIARTFVEHGVDPSAPHRS